MSAKDTYHQTVVKALQKDKWLITHDPLHIKYGGFNFLIGLGAENLLGATKNGHKIAIEIKKRGQTPFKIHILMFLILCYILLPVLLKKESN